MWLFVEMCALNSESKLIAMRTNRMRVKARTAKKRFRTISIQITTTIAFLFGFTVIGGIVAGSGIA